MRDHGFEGIGPIAARLEKQSHPRNAGTQAIRSLGKAGTTATESRRVLGIIAPIRDDGGEFQRGPGTASDAASAEAGTNEPASGPRPSAPAPCSTRPYRGDLRP